MYIITYPAASEYKDREVAIFDDYKTLERFLLNHHGDLSRIRVFEATELGLKLIMEKKDA